MAGRVCGEGKFSDWSDRVREYRYVGIVGLTSHSTHYRE